MLANMAAASMLDREVYLYAEVDRLVGLRGGTAKRWLNGYQRDGKTYDPILRIEPCATPWVTWGEFVETRMLAEFRDVKKVPIPRLRAAIERLRRQYGTQYPLAHLQPFLSVYDRDLTLVPEVPANGRLREDELVIRTGQQLLGDGHWLAKKAGLENDENGRPIFAEIPADRDFPDIVINPLRYSGQPTFAGRRVSPVTIAGMVVSGESRETLAAEYGLSLEQVDQAVAYTERYRLSAA